MSDPATGGRRVGVGMDNQDIFATALTSRNNDFTGNSDKIAVALRNFNAVVFVIKKQKDVLNKLTNGFRTSMLINSQVKLISLCL